MENLVTSQNYAVQGDNPETERLLKYVAGARTSDEKISEFFGIRLQDRSKTPVLKKLGVKFCPALANLGVTLEDLKAFVDGALEDSELSGEEVVEKKKKAKKEEVSEPVAETKAE